MICMGLIINHDITLVLSVIFSVTSIFAITSMCIVSYRAASDALIGDSVTMSVNEEGRFVLNDNSLDTIHGGKKLIQ